LRKGERPTSRASHRREVAVELVHALKRVVFEMVLGERQGAREGLWQVGEQRRQDVRHPSLENQPVRGLVDHDEERVVGERADRVGDDHDDPPRRSATSHATTIWSATIPAVHQKVAGFGPMSSRISG